MKTILLFIVLACFFPLSHAQQITNSQYKEDLDYFFNTVDLNYSYWDKKKTDWKKVREIYTPLADTITSNSSFILLLEKALYELYDHHASLSSNTMESQRLVPSGTDLWAEYINNKPIITEVKKESGSEKTGISPGMEIVMFNDIPVAKAIQRLLPISLKNDDIEAKNFALRLLLAGAHADQRKFTMVKDGRKQSFYPDRPINLLEENSYTADIVSKILKGNIGYLRINNRLGDNDLIPHFDSVLKTLWKTTALVLDLRETPSGGNTTVARAILGRFISSDGYYQKHELTSEEKEYGIKRSWVEIVSPRKPVYTRPLVVLADHWTGSVSEGIVIGFDALKRSTTIGTKMARLNGAVYSFTMPRSGIGFSIPAEKLFHVNGTPRENFIPTIEVDLVDQKNGEDRILDRALRYLNQTLKNNHK
jgi:carboxyl-terminal processing protease